MNNPAPTNPPYGSYAYWHTARNNARAAQNQMPVFELVLTSPDFPDGIMEKGEIGGLVKLYIIENARAQCQNSTDPTLQLWAQQTPHWWAFDPALNSTRFSFTEDEQFNVMTNCFAEQVMRGYNAGYEPATLNSQDPTHTKMYIQGDVIADAGALPANVELNDLPALVQNWLKRSVLRL